MHLVIDLYLPMVMLKGLLKRWQKQMAMNLH
jgi:hypothetical protein